MGDREDNLIKSKRRLRESTPPLCEDIAFITYLAKRKSSLRTIYIGTKAVTTWREATVTLKNLKQIYFISKHFPIEYANTASLVPDAWRVSRGSLKSNSRDIIFCPKAMQLNQEAC